MEVAATTSSPALSDSTGSFGPPRVPETPSLFINKVLQEKCNRKFDAKHKFLAARVACFLMEAIVLLYSRLHKESRPSKQKWMISCGIAAVVACVVTSLVYLVIVSSASLIQSLLYYAALSVALVAVGGCVASVVVFDRDRSQFSQGFEPKRD